MLGKFIVFEGGEKSGKSTQLELLKKYLEDKNFQVVLTREPGSKLSTITQSIREIILNNKNTNLTARAELLLFLADRSQHVSEIIKPALDQGKIVLSDRFDGSSFAYQGAARHLDLEELKSINNWAKSGLNPDLVIYLDITPEQASERSRDEKHDRLDAEVKSFHEAVRAGYLEQAKQTNWVTVSAVGEIEEIFEKIKLAVDKII
ncbi:MAG: dTMP kinase [Patescibacteria group bacterium]|jgi:dTMP kinase